MRGTHRFGLMLLVFFVLGLSLVSAIGCYDPTGFFCEVVGTSGDCPPPNVQGQDSDCEYGCLCISEADPAGGNVVTSSYVRKSRRIVLGQPPAGTQYYFDTFVPEASCSATCQDYVQSSEQCLLNEEIIDDCMCGQVSVNGGDGKYCCQGALAPEVSNTPCTLLCGHGAITSPCECAGNTETDGYCCYGQYQATPCTEFCVVGEPVTQGCFCEPDEATADDETNNRYCCAGGIEDTACQTVPTCSEGIDLSNIYGSCQCGIYTYTPPDPDSYCCGGALQDEMCDTGGTCEKNGILDDGELCDPENTDLSRCTGTPIGCSESCTCMYAIGCDREVDDNYCDQDGDPRCGEGECITSVCVCIDETQCNDDSCYPPPCDGSNPPQHTPILTVRHISGVEEFRLTWTYQDTCEQDVETFWILEKRPGDTAPHFVASTAGDVLEYNVDFQAVEGNPKYCYQIQARYDNMNSEPSPEVCVTMGDVECYESRGRGYCDGTTAVTCTNENAKEEGECSPKICKETVAGPLCKYQHECDLCNNAYQNFGVYGETEGEDLDGDGDPDSYPRCDQTEVSCFLEYEPNINDHFSPTPRYLPCSSVDTCKDYKTEYACGVGNTHCLVGDCEWESLDDSIGIGFCKDLHDDSSFCYKCNELAEQSPFFTCNEDACENLGKCYYSTVKDQNGECVAEEDMVCEWYNSASDCNPGGYVLDVEYTDDERTGGTHEVNPSSNDVFNLGKCRWRTHTGGSWHYTPRCFKDSDYNYDNSPSTTFSSISDYILGNEAILGIKNRDFTSPVSTTTASASPDDPLKTGKEVEIPLGATDEDTSITGTYLCVTPIEDDECYPGSSDYLDDSTGMFTGTFEDGGIYRISFYSQDDAKNLEEIQEAYFQVINDTPVMEITYESEAYEVDNDLYLSDLNVTVDVKTSEGTTLKALCTGGFTGETTPGPGDIKNAYNSQFNLSYEYVPDGSYYFSISCTDSFGNTGQAEAWIEVEGDRSITNIAPSPPETYATTEGMEITFETLAPSACRVSATSPLWEDMVTQGDQTVASTSNGRIHVFPLANLGTGVFNYYIACLIDGTGEIIENRYGDSTKFAVDKLPPVTRVLDHSGEPFDFDTQTEDEFKMKFECNDNSPLLLVDAINWNAGCEGTWFKSNGMLEYEEYSDQPLTKNKQDSPIYLYSQDTLGNVEDVETIYLTVQDVVDPTVILFTYFNITLEE